MDQSIDIFPIRIRLLQETHQPGHLALVNWGLYSRDRYWPGPADARPKLWDEFKRDENDPYGEDVAEDLRVPQAEIKQERAEDDPYDEKAGAALCERLHGPGGPDKDVRGILRIVYVYRYVREEQYTRQAGCSQDAFCERLEAGLRFAGRFV